MHFSLPTSIIETSSFLPAFFKIVDEARFLRRADQLMADARKSPFGWKIVTDHHWLEVEIAHMQEVSSLHQEIPPDALDLRSIAALNFVAFVVEAHSRMSNHGRRVLDGRLRDCLKNGFQSLYHEMETARQLMDENFEVQFADFEGTAEHDIVFRKGALEGEVECKSLSADAGRKVHRKDFYRFVETIYAELEKSVAMKGCRAVVITVDDRFPSSVREQEPMRRVASQFLANPAKEKCEDAGFSIEAITGNQRLHEISALGARDQYAKCREVFGESCHVAGAFHAEGGCLLVVRSRREDDHSKPTLEAIKEAMKQASGSKPCYVAVQYDDIEPADLAVSHVRRRAAVISNYAFHTQESGHVAGVCFSAFAGLHQHGDSVTMPRIVFCNPQFRHAIDGLPFLNDAIPYARFAELLGVDSKLIDPDG